MDTETIYQRLPLWLQNAACSLEGWRLQGRRYNSDYGAAWRMVNESAGLGPQGLENLRRNRLRAHLRSAEHSPFWKGRFRQYAVVTGSDNPWTELQKLPVVNKTEIQSEADRIRNSIFHAKELVACHTSGTTGGGLRFWESRAAERERWAVWWRYRKWHGIDRETWCGYFGGRSVVPLSQRKPPFWRINHPGRQIMFSGYHLGPDTAGDYIRAIEQFRPPWLHGYPSLLTLIATYILERGRPLNQAPRIVTTGAENLLSQQRRVIERAFGCPVRQHYGLSEAVANFSECEHGVLHVDEDFADVEFIQSEVDDDTYRIVGTNWSNAAFPLLRYDTGDLARLSENTCSCQRAGRVVSSIDGRQEDYVVMPDGTKIGRLDHIFKDMVRIREAQIYQPSKDTLIFRVVRNEGFGELDERELLGEARKRLRDVIQLKIEYVDALIRSQTGKLRFVVSDIA